MEVTKEYRLQFDSQAKEIVFGMTLEEKVNLMTGNYTLAEIMENMEKGYHYNETPYASGGNKKRGVPSMLFCDGPRGVVCGRGKATCFPVSMLRGATFDSELETEIGKAIGRETRAFGGNLVGSVCVNIPYHPGWGRSQETYGEDTYAVGTMGSAAVHGIQSEGVIACVKHYAFNSIENIRFWVNVNADRRAEREVYLPQFKDCVDAGAASVMSSYNLYQGEYCGENQYLLKEVLKEQWGFDGFVISDFYLGVRSTVSAVNAGMDIEMPDIKMFGKRLVKAVRKGKVSEEQINDASTRIVRTLLAFDTAYKESKQFDSTEVLGCELHKSLALKCAQEGIVLLENKNNELPLGQSKNKMIAVFGILAAKENLGDHGSSRVYPNSVVTILEGIRQEFPKANVVYCDGNDLDMVRKLAGEADRAVIVAGCDYNDEGEFMGGNKAVLDGIKLSTFKEKIKIFKVALKMADPSSFIGGGNSKEGGDRKDGVSLQVKDIELIHIVGKANPHTTVVLIGGNVLLTEEWRNDVSAILMAFYPGQEGGTAIAQILSGAVNPSGKLPFVVPKREEDLPAIDWGKTEQTYAYYHGYQKLEKENHRPRYPYGFGLSYTTFSITGQKAVYKDKILTVSCKVCNKGNVAGAEVIQLYVGFTQSSVDRPIKRLVGFRRVYLERGEEKEITISAAMQYLRYYDEASQMMVLEKMDYDVYIGNNEQDVNMWRGKVRIV